TRSCTLSHEIRGRRALSPPHAAPARRGVRPVCGARRMAALYPNLSPTSLVGGGRSVRIQELKRPSKVPQTTLAGGTARNRVRSRPREQPVADFERRFG